MTVLDAVVMVVVLYALFLGRQALQRRRERSWLPPALTGARLRFSEKTFLAARPRAMVARVDRVYETERGDFVLVDFKRRRTTRALPADVVELSAQRVALQASGHRCVSMTAFVAVVDPITHRVTPVEVRLEAEREIYVRQVRYVALLEGQLSPRGATSPAVCRGCGHRRVCPQRIARVGAPDPGEQSVAQAV